MKKIALLITFSLIMLVAPKSFSQAEWSTVNVGDHPTNMILDIKFADASIGYALAGEGEVFKTINGGASWFQTNAATDIMNLSSSMSVIDANTVYIGLGNGNLKITTDGGDSWNSTPDTGDGTMHDLHFFDANNGIAVGDLGEMKRTNDGGATWTPGQVTAAGAYLDGLEFINSTTGYTVGAGIGGGLGGGIYKTTDAGLTWQQAIPEGSVTGFNTIDFPDINTGYVGGGFSELYKTTDAGATWTPITNTGLNSTTDHIVSIDFVDANIGFVVANTETSPNVWSTIVLKTIDGGANWIDTNYNTDVMYTVKCIGADEAFLGGYYEGPNYPSNTDDWHVRLSKYGITTVPDTDGDTVTDDIDNCIDTPNPNQADWNNDGEGDVCDDTDGDGIFDDVDNCIETPNTGQEDWNNDGEGDACDDTDGDGVMDDIDTCIEVPNGDTQNVDLDQDGIADACDDDIAITISVPDTVTPNGDGSNDTWEIINITQHSNNTVKVFNRWGVLVYETAKYGITNQWNGESSEGGSGLLPAGSYYYVIELNNPSVGVYGTTPITGWLYLNY